MPYLRLSLAALAFLMLAACAGAASAGLREYPFRLESEQKGDGHEIVAHNDGPAAITVYVSLADQENIASDRKWPLTAVVPPKQSLVLGRLFRATARGAYRFSFKYRHQFGDVAAVHDPSTPSSSVSPTAARSRPIPRPTAPMPWTSSCPSARRSWRHAPAW
ncbi:MAG: hypothetical protein H6R12_2185 [Proteobacteria bacterium]|nr:hypothetical protein [Pseudomonadota bacterium]